MKYQQKPQAIDAFTFPTDLYVSLIEGAVPEFVPAGSYLLFAKGQIEVMSKKDFRAEHDLVNDVEHDLAPQNSKPRTSKPRKEPKTPKRGLAKSVLEQQAQAQNEAEQDAS